MDREKEKLERDMIFLTLFFSQLYRSSSFNSSGRGSICDTAEDMYSDVSLEDDVLDLNHRVSTDFFKVLFLIFNFTLYLCFY